MSISKNLLFAPVAMLLLNGCSDLLGHSSSEQIDTTETSVQPQTTQTEGGVRLLSAFYGLDDDLPLLVSLFVCDGSTADDGMPVIFSHELDMETVQAGDFRVILADGGQGSIVCATPAPAFDLGEFRTILLAGDFGSIDNQPVVVEISGNILPIKKSRLRFELSL